MILADEKSLPAQGQAGQNQSTNSISFLVQESTHSVMLIDGFIGKVKDFRQYLKETKPIVNLYKRRFM